MADLKTKFIGLELKSPIIIASAGITETIERMRKCQDYGAGAIIMKSYFEEVISRKSPTPRFKIIKHDLGKEHRAVRYGIAHSLCSMPYALCATA